jgi:hypothetical protein
VEGGSRSSVSGRMLLVGIRRGRECMVVVDAQLWPTAASATGPWPHRAGESELAAAGRRAAAGGCQAGGGGR